MLGRSGMSIGLTKEEIRVVRGVPRENTLRTNIYII
jgi:hypothetical protein